MVIAIDGPSGVGKGTVARALARRLGYRHVDTGAMYRALAWLAVHDGYALDDEERLSALAERVAFSVDERGVRIDAHDVTSAIRTPDIDKAVTSVARLPRVRAALVARQRQMRGDHGLVMEGRDIGTVVFPDADLKVYLDASPEERARRRASDPAHVGTQDVTSVATALQARDQADRTRAASPLYMAPDAVLIDTTGVPIDDVVARVMALVRR